MIGWLEIALLPLRDGMTAAEDRRLAVRLRAAVGVEALVWLMDVAGVERAEVGDMLMSSARTLLHAERSTRSPTP